MLYKQFLLFKYKSSVVSFYSPLPLLQLICICSLTLRHGLFTSTGALGLLLWKWTCLFLWHLVQDSYFVELVWVAAGVEEHVPHLFSTLCSVREVEVVVRVIVVLTLAETRHNKMESHGYPGEAEPNAEGEVVHPSLQNKALETSVHEMEEPLLGSVGTMMPDVASRIRCFLIEVLFSVPSSPLLLGYTQTFAKCESHVLLVTEFVVLKSTSY